MSVILCFRELHYPEADLDKVINKLLEQLHHKNAVIRAAAAWTLGELGVDSEKVLSGLIPMLTDSDVSDNVLIV